LGNTGPDAGSDYSLLLWSGFGYDGIVSFQKSPPRPGCRRGVSICTSFRSTLRAQQPINFCLRNENSLSEGDGPDVAFLNCLVGCILSKAENLAELLYRASLSFRYVLLLLAHSGFSLVANVFHGTALNLPDFT
jgi:hypothetical protein